MSPRTPDEIKTINLLVKGFETVIEIVAKERSVDRQLSLDALEYLFGQLLVEVLDTWEEVAFYFDGPVRDRLRGTWNRLNDVSS
jgi:hypothetical protein